MKFTKTLATNVLTAALVFLDATHSAWASGDYECTPDMDICRASLAMLRPDNDSLVNLELLLMDAGLGALHAPADLPQKLPVGAVWVPPTSNALFSTYWFKSLLSDPLSEDGDGVEGRFQGGGSIADSNVSGTAEFVAAVKQTQDLPAAEAKELIQARTEKRAAKGIQSAAGKEFQLYLDGALLFYDTQFFDAIRKFSMLTVGSHQPWLKEVSLYMVGRARLNMAQKRVFDDYTTTFSKLNRQEAGFAELGFKNYLAVYPKGQYASSARGLIRRIYWLRQDKDALLAEFLWNFENSKSPQASHDHLALLEEFDRLADVTSSKTPLFMAYRDLLAMRNYAGPFPLKAKITLAQLQAQQPAFKDQPQLFSYLLAAQHFFVEHDAAAALKELPAELPAELPYGSLSYLEFSAAMLRGMALEKRGDWKVAQTLWERLIPKAVQPLQRASAELQLALNYERHNNVARAFAKDSLIQDPQLRQNLLNFAANADILRQQATAQSAPASERHVARSVLLEKDLLRGQYADFARDMDAFGGTLRFDPKYYNEDGYYEPYYNSIGSEGTYYYDAYGIGKFAWTGSSKPDQYPCPDIKQIAARLALDKDDAKGLLCLGDFVRLHSLEATVTLPDKDSLGGIPTRFAGQPFLRDAAYVRIMQDPKAAYEDKAYALYRAINCYASGRVNGCSHTEVPVKVRKQWFATLKKDFSKSRWSQTLKYYW